MANNNVQNIKFLRNGSLFTSRTEARAALETNKGLGADGSAILARYSGGTVGESDFIVKTLIGFVYSGANGTFVTTIDVDDAGTDAKAYVDSLVGTGVSSSNTVTSQLETLSGSSSDNSGATSVEGAKAYAKDYTDAAIANLDVTAISAGDGAFIKSVSQADGKVSATTADMPTVAAISETGKAIISVSQSKGTISASAGNIDSQYVDVSYSAITATNVKAALAEIADEINAMDKSASAVDGQVVTTVSEADGVVSETKANVKDLQLGGYAKDASAIGDIASTDTINAALSKLENKVGANKITNADKSIVVTEPTGTATTTDIKVNIKSGEKVIKLGEDGIYTNLNLVKITTGLGETVKESYEFRDSDGNKIGESINIAKDSHIVSITYDETTQKLIYKYLDASGVEQTTEVDMAHLILETEVENGIQSVNGKLSIKLDTTGDDTGDNKFLTVGANGLKLDGVTDAINAAIESLDATGGTQTIATDKHVAVEVIEADGKITAVTVTEDNIADADDLAALSAKTVTEIGSSNSSIAVATATTTVSDGTVKYDVITDASKIKMTGFTSTDVLSGINSTSSVTEAFKEVDKVITDNERVVSAALNDLEATKVENITVNGVNGTFSDKIASVTIDGADIKLDGYASGSSSAAVVATDTVNQAIGKLENQVKAAKAAATTVVAEGTDAGNNMSIDETADADGHKIYTVNLSDVASAQGLANEIAARKAVDGVNGNAYTTDTNAHYINTATTLYGADQALDTALNTVDNAMLTGVTAGNGIEVEAKNNKSQTISAKVNGDGGIVNDSAGLHLGYIDAGVYDAN